MRDWVAVVECRGSKRGMEETATSCERGSAEDLEPFDRAVPMSG